MQFNVSSQFFSPSQHHAQQKNTYACHLFTYIQTTHTFGHQNERPTGTKGTKGKGETRREEEEEEEERGRREEEEGIKYRSISVN